MTVTEADKLAEYVRQNVPIIELRPPLLHASLCVLDALYAARQRYEERVTTEKAGASSVAMHRTGALLATGVPAWRLASRRTLSVI